MNPYILKTNNAVKKIVVIYTNAIATKYIYKAKLSESEKPISEDECQQAILQLANNKSSGLDGFSIELYKTFWTEIKSRFMQCLDFSKLTNQLSESQYESLITLLPKPGKDKLFASNYRPITLLNCDYKIISNRIDPFLNELIEKE